MFITQLDTFYEPFRGVFEERCKIITDNRRPIKRAPFTGGICVLAVPELESRPDLSRPRPVLEPDSD